MPASDGFYLCLFSNDKVIVIDDSIPALKNIYSIATVWPNLATYNMADNLDAVYVCETYKELAFFKGGNCAIYNYGMTGGGAWKNGPITNFFTPSDPTYSSNLTAASTGEIEEYYTFYKGTKWINGAIANQDPFNKVVLLNNSSGDITTDAQRWNITSSQQLVASTRVCELNSFGQPGNPGNGTLQRAMFVFDSSDGHYKFTFDQSGTGTYIPGDIPLSALWSGYSDSAYPIQAAFRADPRWFASVQPIQGGPGPVISNPICCELGNIMKSVCSLTLLMHKAIDACYPQNMWPTQPYPDGCANSSGDCGCGGQKPSQSPPPAK